MNHYFYHETNLEIGLQATSKKDDEDRNELCTQDGCQRESQKCQLIIVGKSHK